MSKSKYSELEKIPIGLNKNITSPSACFYNKLLGEPRLDRVYSYKPSVPTNPALLKICKTHNVGPFQATGLKPAVDSLKKVMSEIAKTCPDLIGRLHNDGMHVVRYISNTTTLSNHSWGGAIDLYVDSIKDKRGDDKILHGLALIAPIFNNHGWYSGAGYKPKKSKKTGKLKSNEDSMHFEVSKELLLEWAKAGDLGPRAEKVAKSPGLRAESTRTPTPGSRGHEARARQTISTRVNTNILKRGDKGPAVQLLQKKLNKAGARPQLEPDASFGRLTEEAVRSFQRRKHLKVTGIVDRETQEALSRIRIETPSLWERLLTGMQRIYH